MKHLVSLKRAARQLQVQVPTLRGWRLKRSHLEFVKVGGRVCVTQESIDEFVTANILLPLPTEARASHHGGREKSKAQTFCVSRLTCEEEKP